MSALLPVGVLVPAHALQPQHPVRVPQQLFQCPSIKKKLFLILVM
jgi:hypothetical protein